MHGPGQVVRHPNGTLMLWVRTEERRGEAGNLYVSTRADVVYTSWVKDGEEIPGELVNDTAGRAEAEVWRELLRENEAKIAALALVLKQACLWLAKSQAADLRALYVEQLA